MNDPTNHDVNVNLLEQMLSYLTANPHIHNQGTWLRYDAEADVDTSLNGPIPSAIQTLELTCRTAGCLAGWTALAVGYAPTWSPDMLESADESGDLLFSDYVTTTPSARPLAMNGTRFRDGGTRWHVDQVATTALELTDHESDMLFNGDNTLRDLWEYAVVLSNGELSVPVELRDAPTCFVNHAQRLDRAWYYRDVKHEFIDERDGQR